MDCWHFSSKLCRTSSMSLSKSSVCANWKKSS